MRIAIFITGEYRSFDLIKHHIYNNIIKPNNISDTIDIFSCVESISHKPIGFNVISYQHALPDAKSQDYIKSNLFPEYTRQIEFSEPQDYKNYIENACQLIRIANMRFAPRFVATGVIEYYQLKKCIDMLQEYEKINNIRYDCIVRIRPDIVWFKECKLSNFFEPTCDTIESVLNSTSFENEPFELIVTIMNSGGIPSLIKRKDNINKHHRLILLKYVMYHTPSIINITRLLELEKVIIYQSINKLELNECITDFIHEYTQFISQLNYVCAFRKNALYFGTRNAICNLSDMCQDYAKSLNFTHTVTELSQEDGMCHTWDPEYQFLIHNLNKDNLVLNSTHPYESQLVDDKHGQLKIINNTYVDDSRYDDIFFSVIRTLDYFDKNT